MVTPAVAIAVRVPLPIETVVVSVPPSTSATVIALPLAVENTLATSSLVACATGTVLTGASLTGMTLIVAIAVFEALLPSVTTTSMVLGVLEGVSLPFAKVMARIAAW